MELTGLPYPGCPEPAWTRPLWSTAYRPKPEGAHYSPPASDKVISFIALLRHYKGEYAGRQFYMLPWQEHELIRPLFGWKLGDCTARAVDGLVIEGTCECKRLYRNCYNETPKKNGKTQLGAGIAGYMAFADGESGAEVYTYAADKDQARLAFDALGFGISYEGSPFETKGIEVLARLIRNKRTNSFVKVQSSDVKTKHGPNAYCIIFDELHAQSNRDLWDVTTSGVAAREEPLVCALTTAGWDRNSICYEQHDHARQVAEGILDDPTFLGVVYSAPDDADWTKKETWYASAPSLGVTVKEDFYVQKCREAVQQPTAQNSFRQLFLSQWTQQAVRFIPLDKWDACNIPVDLTKLVKALAYGGLDLSATTDLSAFAILFPHDDDYDLIVRYFIPEENMHARERRDRVPYQTWVEQGLIVATPGDVIDYEFIKQSIIEAKDTYDLREISYDPWNAVDLVQQLEKLYVKLAPMRQGYQSMNAPVKELLRLIIQKKIHHGGNPVLRWNMDSAAATTDAQENVKLDKRKSSARIDGTVATVMALDAALRNPTRPRKSVYAEENRGVLAG